MIKNISMPDLQDMLRAIAIPEELKEQVAKAYSIEKSRIEEILDFDPSEKKLLLQEA